MPQTQLSSIAGPSGENSGTSLQAFCLSSLWASVICWHRVPGTDLNPRQLLHSSWVTGDDSTDRGEGDCLLCLDRCTWWGDCWELGLSTETEARVLSVTLAAFYTALLSPDVLLGTLVFISCLVTTVPVYLMTGSAQGWGGDGLCGLGPLAG